MQGPEDEDKYVANFREGNASSLTMRLSERNAAKRRLAKLCLKYFLGILTESNKRQKTKMIADSQEIFFEFLAMPCLELTNLLFTGDNDSKFPLEQLAGAGTRDRLLLGLSLFREAKASDGPRFAVLHELLKLAYLGELFTGRQISEEH